MVSTIPKVVYDYLSLLNMDIFSSYHEHANGDISEIQGNVKDVHVTFFKRNATVDFFIRKPNQGNIVLGSDFFRAMKGFIDIGKGHIRLRGKAKGTYPFPRKNKDELVESDFEEEEENDDMLIEEEYDGEDMPQIEWNRDNPNLNAGAVYKNMVELRNALTMYCIQRNNVYGTEKNEKRKLTVHCPYPRCSWKLHASGLRGKKAI
ncbi:hypothetical protein D1007_25544 [Hordeum vulgare]|nr:hypothetical protein D1007_25544 [Hordeum vulgare]